MTGGGGLEDEGAGAPGALSGRQEVWGRGAGREAERHKEEVG